MVDRRQFLQTTSMAGGAFFAGSARLLGHSSKPIPGAVITTTAGRVRGLLSDGVQAFKAIPYGASTAGTRRFLPPVAVAPWTGVREAFAFGPRAPQVLAAFVPEWQPLTGTESMSEDCLHLNVWTPRAAGGRRPVMVWLHGGGYTGGSPAALPYDGANLARWHDVVVVSITHRLNVLGFIHLRAVGEERFADASNAGQKDIIAGLTWVRDNIDRFGGDPKNVTIFGQSGGAGKVSTLLGMPAAQGLFHRAIAQSGSAVTSMPADTATQHAEALMLRLGLKLTQADALQKLPLDQVLNAMAPPAGGRGGFITSPVVDGTSLPHDVFSPSATPLSAAIPLLIGSTETEVTWSVNTDYASPADAAALRDRMTRTLRVDESRARMLVDVYRQGRPHASLLDLALIMETDASQFRSGVDLQAERKSASGQAPVYMYRFQWYSPVSGGRLRAMHCMDIPFAFDNVDNSQSIVGSAADRQPLADRMSGAWVSFARGGDPNHEALPRWKPFTAGERATMMLNTDCSLAQDPFRDERTAMAAAIASR